VFTTRPAELLDARAAVRAGQPLIRRPELEFRKIRSGGDRVDGGEERGGVHAVQGHRFPFVPNNL
jgi:hypothetical protein